MSDISLTCRNCGSEFHFTVGEQAFYMDRGFHPPAFCPDCRDLRRATIGERELGAGTIRRQLHEAICSRCGAITRVPFEPSPDRAVYCESCFTRQRTDKRN